MEKKTYIIFTKSEDMKKIQINASGQTTSQDGLRVTFQDSDRPIAIFNMAEIVGFAQADHVVN